MYKRLIIFSVIIISALCGVGWLGYRSIQVWVQGIEGTRIGEFAQVAEQIRRDVKRKLDEFMQQEQNRPYTDYQYFYVPDDTVTAQQQTALLRSPLAGQFEHGLSLYNFQIQPDGAITTPNINLEQQQAAQAADAADELYARAVSNTKNVEKNLLPVLGDFEEDASARMETPSNQSYDQAQSRLTAESEPATKEFEDYPQMQAKGSTKLTSSRAQNYPIESLQQSQEQSQVLTQRRDLVFSNEAQIQSEAIPLEDTDDRMNLSSRSNQQGGRQAAQQPQTTTQTQMDDIVEIRIEPFTPVVVPTKDNGQSFFGGQVFMVRRVKIEDKNYLQGFQLNEQKLIEEVKESTRRLKRDWMSFELAKRPGEQSNYTAVLDFVGLGNLILNLTETDPAWIDRQTSHLRNWYVWSMSIVVAAVVLGLASLWLNTRAQVRLAQKKDDFISAVSHELRTPLTSIRMYSEMLEKNWVKSEDKLAEYYKNMRQESERLSRLIENVLDFSRIQRGRKNYTFKPGDLNKCIGDVVEKMRPYAKLRDFDIQSEFGLLDESRFDHDAITQIIINLLDNAIKYAQNAADKTIIVRTSSDAKFIYVEIEDHGPGIPNRQRKKVFEQFYRCGPEATRETTGTGLGLALVKRFTEAHSGSVEIINAKPSGTIIKLILPQSNTPPSGI